MNDKCEVCDAVLSTKTSREAMTWDWFTGRLDRTVHFCPDHIRSERRRQLVAEAQDTTPMTLDEHTRMAFGREG